MQEKNGRSKIIQLIHIAKSQIGLSDEDYRAVLESTAKKTSCSEMTLFELNEVLKAMKKLGFKVKKLETREEEIGWDASKAQMDYIKGMWELVARDKSDRALYKFIKRITGADHPRFMRSVDSQKVIVALRKMMVSAGLNPDRKEV
ncbi:MAG: regulatory protein GemA [Treponema sp.]|nr:regulatory protein GemA [Treponema sp.]